MTNFLKKFSGGVVGVIVGAILTLLSVGGNSTPSYVPPTGGTTNFGGDFQADNITSLGDLTITDDTVINGVTSSPERTTMTSATTTPCTILAPSSTTTVSLATLNITTPTTTAITWALSTSTTAYATGTPAFTITVPANVQGTYSVVPSATHFLISAPGVYWHWSVYGLGTGGLGYGGGGAGVITAGTCINHFQSVN